MSTFERYLTLWVALCIAVGVALGHGLPGLFQAIGSAEVAQVNLPVAVLIWLIWTIGPRLQHTLSHDSSSAPTREER